MLEIGSLVDGKYRILSEIGHGGMSIVYMAINEKANKTWAIKEVRKDGINDFEIVKQGLIVETDMLKKLNHPHLPSIIDVIDTEERFLIVMDYIEGNTLSKALDEYGAQLQEDVITWAKQLCDVLGYLHSRKPPIIYRDMKPSNVMLKPDGNVTLIDFGTAREYKEKNIADTTCLGTVGYAAPEQFGGQGQTDARTDIYCLGATLYHLLTGRSPCEPPYEILPIRQINPNLSSGLEKIILKCTQRNPDDRYQSCAELMYALEHYDEIDDLYIKKQKSKLSIFLVTTLLAIIFLVAGGVTTYLSIAETSDNYLALIDKGDKSTTYEDKLKYFTEAIDLKPEESNAYFELINTFKENDSIFTVEEEEEIISYMTNNKQKISSSENYADLCFEIGKLYWYYYSYGNTTDNTVTRAKASITWFDEAMKIGGTDFDGFTMARIYRDIGIFYRDIEIKAVEAGDKGMYKDFFENLIILIDEYENNTSESEIVRLELFEMVRNVLRKYPSKLKTDGIPKDEMLSLLDRVSNATQDLEATSNKAQEKRKEILESISFIKQEIENAFED